MLSKNLLLCLLFPLYGLAQKAPLVSAIREADLKKDLYEMAGDHFRGREAGTLDELNVSVWWAEKLRAIGLEPAGDNGTYFQFFSMERNRVSPASSIRVGSRNLKLWEEVFVGQTAPATVQTTMVLTGRIDPASLAKLDLRGKAVVIEAAPDSINLNVSLPERRYMGYVLRRYATVLRDGGAAAVLFLTDDWGEKAWVQTRPAAMRGSYDIEGGPNAILPTRMPVLWLHKRDGAELKTGDSLQAHIQIEHFQYPSVNIVARVRGTDPKLSGEYVLFSGHQDHDGVRLPYGSDSIYNGADDNASVSVALLAIARTFKKQPGKRSALFVWHGAEERGLLGSRWYAAHPTVPAASIVAVLNGDMIGRNHPDSAALLGRVPPHRNSTDLVSLALQANAEGPKFRLDTLWDRPDHVEGWYFRSDHLPYARAGYPAVFYTTLLHPDYHTPMDDAEHIDYRKLQRMTEWIYRTGWKLANAAQRPKVDPGFKLER